MPSSRNCSEVCVKSARQDVILEACWLRPRPISVRNVWTSGTKGVGGGMYWRSGRSWWRSRSCGVGDDRVRDSGKVESGRNVACLHSMVKVPSCSIVSRASNGLRG